MVTRASTGIQTVRWPFQRTARGGLARTSDTDQGVEALEQLFGLAFLPGPAPMPFHAAAGLCAPSLEFGNPDDQAALVSYAHAFFARLESQGRARLVSGPTFREIGADDPGGLAEGALVIDIEYENLESAQPGSVRIPVR